MIPETLSHYRIVEKLGAGAMGEVYLAKDTKLDRTVALKILPPEFADNPERLERFVREAKAASAIKHANVAHIYEIGEADGVHFIAMEHVEGETLAARLSGKLLPTKDILDIGVQVADALDEAHGKRITHRDIKPGNLMLTDRGQIKMLDFGLAKMAATSEAESDAPTEAKTTAGMVMGTVQYMSPEQALGRDVDGRSDIFSLGVVLYELTTGRLPFSGASSLSKLPNVRVISRTSAFHYKGQAIDPERVGRELGVEALVLGRVVQRGDDLTISAELVRTDDSGQIWGEQYQRKAADIFSIQNDMAREISDALRIQLTTEQEGLLTKQFTASSDAYQAYLKGRYHLNRRTEEGIRQAIVHFQEAIDQDPNYALAYTGLADSFSLLGYYYDPPREVYPRAKQAAERALALDDSLGEAHVSLAWIKCFYDWEFDEAEREFLRGIELNPTYATAHQWYSVYLVVMGRYNEAIERIRIALELEPLSRIINSNYAQFLGYSGRYEEAREQFRKTVELDPAWAYAHWQLGLMYESQGLFSEATPHLEKAAELDDRPYGLGQLGYVYAKSGRIDEAHGVLERLDELAETRYVSPIEKASVYAGLGDLDRFFEWMEKAYEERTSEVPLVRILPFIDDVEQDPRFVALMRRIGLEE